ncbi:MAG: sugar phosphate isomerase/epimerase [Phycisphaerae bacterium]|nr:sugar phosphate isomerase/epimerase [Phycisphaerae bacterium]
MKIGISSWGYRKTLESGRMDFLGFVDETARLGAQGVEVANWHLAGGPGGPNAEKASALKRIVEHVAKSGLEVSALIAGNDFAVPSIADRAEQVAATMGWIRMAADVGIDHVNVFTGYHVDGQDPELERARVVDCYLQVIPEAEKGGVTLCLENHSTVHPDADGLLAIIRQVGSEHLKTNPDPTNFVAGFDRLDDGARERIYVDTAKIAPMAANSHLKINTFTPDGQVEFVDVARIIDIYRQVGYDGFIVLEYWGDGEPEGPNAQGVELLKRLLA